MSGKPVIRLVFKPKSGWMGDAKSLPISYRELEILCLLGEGKSNQQIAKGLGISYQTVKNHIYRINKKLGAKNNTQAIVIAMHAGLIYIDIRPDDWPFDEHGNRIAPDPEWVKKLREEG